MVDQTGSYSYEHRSQYPKELEGTFEQRVFVGGHYDFMPILRFIADCVSEIRTRTSDPFIPVIPYFHNIDPHAVMEEDRQMVRNCARAIFDVSDLGGQLIEIEEAFRLNKPTLLVYPVREDSDLDPERGRLTITTCGHPFISYVTFDELKEKIAIFLLGLKESKGYLIRALDDEEQESAIFHIHSLIRDERYGEARKAINKLNSQNSQGVVDAWLALALIEQREGDLKAVKHALHKASQGSIDKRDKAEVAYYRGLIAIEVEHWEKAKREFMQAERLRPDNPRILNALTYAYRRVGGQRNLNKAIKYAEKALEILKKEPSPKTEIQQRMATIAEINARNNLAYYICEAADAEQDIRKKTRLVSKAMILSEELPVYHRRLRRRNPAWLHTRGCALLLDTELHGSVRSLEDAKTIIGHARAMGTYPQAEKSWKRALELTYQLRSCTGGT